MGVLCTWVKLQQICKFRNMICTKMRLAVGPRIPGGAIALPQTPAVIRGWAERGSKGLGIRRERKGKLGRKGGREEREGGALRHQQESSVK